MLISHMAFYRICLLLEARLQEEYLGCLETLDPLILTEYSRRFRVGNANLGRSITEHLKP